MPTFLFILIVTSGMELFGYSFIDVALMGFFLFLINLQKTSVKIKINWVLIFCIYMIFQVARGMLVLGDFRMIYWLFFFVIVYFAHTYWVDLQKKSKIDIEFAKKVFNYSMVYFIIYGLLAVLIKNPDDFQGIYWVGSSAAFIIIIPLLCSHFVIAKKSNFSLSALRFPSLLIFLIIATVHYSRMGQYLLLLYLIYLVYKSATFSIKKLSLIIAFISISFIVLDTTRALFYTDAGETGSTEIAQFNSLIDDDPSLEELEGDLNRFLMVLSIYQKLISSPTEFLIGSGWYTSRYTLKPYETKVFNDFGQSATHAGDNKPMQVTSLAGIFSDTGIIGFLFMLYFFFKSSAQILRANSGGSALMISFLFINWLFYAVGFSFISIISFLIIFPDGLLVSLARAGSMPNQLIKKSNLND